MSLQVRHICGTWGPMPANAPEGWRVPLSCYLTAGHAGVHRAKEPFAKTYREWRGDHAPEVERQFGWIANDTEHG